MITNFLPQPSTGTNVYVSKKNDSTILFQLSYKKIQKKKNTAYNH